MTQLDAASGPDLTQGVALAALTPEGKLVGYVGDREVLLVRSGGTFFAIDAHCSHYHGPLADGLVADGQVHCPWHHACFDLRSGEALAAPAFTPLDCWDVEVRGDRVFVGAKRAPPPPRKAPADAPRRMVIVGGGAAGFAAAEMLRREGFDGGIVLLSGEASAPVDRPNLSKDYLAGSAPEDWMPLRPDDFYRDSGIDLRLGTAVAAIDVERREARTRQGEAVAYDRLLLATGAEPVRLPVAGAERPHVHTLRTLADARAIIAGAAKASRALVIGASFIGLEAAAALRMRGLEVHVVAPEKIPMQRVFGADMGGFVRALHEEHGVVFHLEDTVAAIGERDATLQSGARIGADLVVVGVGVRPRLALAESAGLALDRGVVVDAHLQTSVPGIYAAGDIARWPDPHSGQRIRVEHWAVAQRQGQTAARNMLGRRERFAAVPFFWSQHYDVPINYVGHAEEWDEIVREGDIAAKDCLLTYKSRGRTLAVVSIFRDLASLAAEAAMERATA